MRSLVGIFFLSISSLALPSVGFADCTIDSNGPTDAPEIRLSQLGLQIGAPSKAVFSSPTQTPTDWSLYNSERELVASGSTFVFGESVASGGHVHQIDLPKNLPAGENFTIES